MLETIKYATISRIYIKDLKFYEDLEAHERLIFCKYYNVTFLPSIDKIHCYKLNSNSFQKMIPPKEIRCQPYDLLFNEETLSKFDNGNHDDVLFVMEDEKIKGVVHIVDFNSEFLYFEFYKLIHKMEKNLRELFIKNNESNGAFIEWMRSKYFEANGRKKDFWSTRLHEFSPEDPIKASSAAKKIGDCSQFQAFYFSDLLLFGTDKNHLPATIKKEIDSINYIRNWVAHNKDVVTDRNEEEPLYNIEGLKKFIRNAMKFFDAFELIENQLKSLKKVQ